MSTVSVRQPGSLQSFAKNLVIQDHVAMDQFIARAQWRKKVSFGNQELFNLNPAVGRLRPKQILYETNICAHDGLQLRGEALHGRRSAASGLWRCCSHPPDRQSGGHSRPASDLLRQPLVRAQLPDLGLIKLPSGPAQKNSATLAAVPALAPDAGDAQQEANARALTAPAFTPVQGGSW